VTFMVVEWRISEMCFLDSFFGLYVSVGVSRLLSCIANAFHLQQLAMFILFILCPNGDGPPADGAQQQKRGCVASVGAIDVRELQQSHQALSLRNVDQSSAKKQKISTQAR